MELKITLTEFKGIEEFIKTALSHYEYLNRPTWRVNQEEIIIITELCGVTLYVDKESTEDSLLGYYHAERLRLTQQQALNEDNYRKETYLVYKAFFNIINNNAHLHACALNKHCIEVTDKINTLKQKYNIKD